MSPPPPTDETRPLMNKRKQRTEKGIMKSSLDIVFSYSRSQQLFFGSHLPSAPSFVDSTTGSTGNDSSYYYFNPSVAPSSARSRAKREGGRRRRLARGDEEGGERAEGDDYYEGDETEDLEEEEEEEEEGDETLTEHSESRPPSPSPDRQHDRDRSHSHSRSRDRSGSHSDDHNNRDREHEHRGRIPSRTRTRGTRKNLNLGNEDVFGFHSPSPSRAGSPTRRLGHAHGHAQVHAQGQGQGRDRETSPLTRNEDRSSEYHTHTQAPGGKGKSREFVTSGPGYGSISTSTSTTTAAQPSANSSAAAALGGRNRKQGSNRVQGVTSGNAFAKSTTARPGLPGAGQESERDLDVDVDVDSDQAQEGNEQGVEPLRKKSSISLRLPTEFSRLTAHHHSTSALNPNTNHPTSTPTATPKSRRASHLDSISTPIRRDARQGSFAASFGAGGRRGSMTFTPVRTPLGADDGQLGQMGQAGQRKMSLGVKDVRGREVEVGRSTSGQTMFNAIAVLVGIGVLSEPLAFAYAGWIGGTVLLIAFGFITNYTAKLLAKIIMSDPNCQGYSDLGIKAFGWKARLWVDVLFCCELFALAIAWIVLLGDSLAVLLGHFSSDGWKIIGFFIVAPTTLLPLHLLSIPSLISLFSSLLLIVILLIDGFSKNAAPGSILHPVQTSLGPDMENYNFLGGLGLLIAGFGGHAIIPSLAIDMKSPEKFDRVVNWAFSIASVIFAISGVAGYLMFGDKVSDAIIKDLLLPEYGFSIPLNQIATWMIVINPIAKFALCCRPLNLTVEAIFGINSLPPPPPSAIDNKHRKSIQEEVDPLESSYTITTGAFPVQPISEDAPDEYVKSEKRKTVLRIIARAAVTAACVVVAIVLPGFGRLMAFLGSFTTFCICVLLPLAFYTAIVPKEERGGFRDAMHLIIFLISLAMCVSGTAWAFVTGERV